MTGKEIPEDQELGGSWGVRLRQPDQGLLAGFGHREQGLDALPDTDAERSRRSPEQTPRSTQRPWARLRPGEAWRLGRPHGGASLEPYKKSCTGSGQETSGPQAKPADPHRPERTGRQGRRPARRGSPRLAHSTFNETREKARRSTDHPQALGPLTCHEHHEDRAAPLSGRDGRRDGALEPQHRSPQAQALAR